ncbi:MAG TPA: hypothetical protein VF624_19080 [Tepidisphaeraceae bacterium]|jgi:hypothetical protein
MNTLIQLFVAFVSAAATVGAIAVTAHVAPEPAPAAVVAEKKSPAANDPTEAFRALQRQQEAWRSTQEHFRQMDRIRSRSW